MSSVPAVVASDHRQSFLLQIRLSNRSFHVIFMNFKKPLLFIAFFFSNIHKKIQFFLEIFFTLSSSPNQSVIPPPSKSYPSDSNFFPIIFCYFGFRRKMPFQLFFHPRLPPSLIFLRFSFHFTFFFFFFFSISILSVSRFFPQLVLFKNHPCKRTFFLCFFNGNNFCTFLLKNHFLL